MPLKHSIRFIQLEWKIVRRDRTTKTVSEKYQQRKYLLETFFSAFFDQLFFRPMQGRID